MSKTEITLLERAFPGINDPLLPAGDLPQSEVIRRSETEIIYNLISAHSNDQVNSEPHNPAAWKSLWIPLQIDNAPASLVAVEDANRCLVTPPMTEDEDWTYRTELHFKTDSKPVQLDALAMRLRQRGIRNSYVRAELTDGDTVVSELAGYLPASPFFRLIEPVEEPALMFPLLSDKVEMDQYHKYSPGHKPGLLPDLWMRIQGRENNNGVRISWLTGSLNDPPISGRDNFVTRMELFTRGVDITLNAMMNQSGPPAREASLDGVALKLRI